jgi:hypothetical protein
MATIDEQKLRRFHAERNAAHAVLLRASEAYRCALADRAEARTKLAEVREPVPGLKRLGDEAEKPYLAALKAAETAMTKAEEERERLSDIHQHAARIWSRCRDFAAAHNALPHDLKD